MMKCMEIREYINQSASSLFNCEVENEIVKVSTPFYYPDGGEIELYIHMDNNTTIVSDLSETYRYLNTFAMNFDNSNRAEIIEKVVRTYNIRFNKGVFFAVIENKQNILEALINLSQALIRVSDLVYTLRESFVSTFRKKVIDLLDDNHINYEVGYKVKSEELDTNYTFDFAIESNKGVNLMNLISSTKEDQKPVIDSHLKTWFDINTNLYRTYPKNNRITLLDDYSYTWKNRDFNLITKLSEVYKWTEKDKLINKLKETA